MFGASATMLHIATRHVESRKKTNKNKYLKYLLQNRR